MDRDKKMLIIVGSITAIIIIVSLILVLNPFAKDLSEFEEIFAANEFTIRDVTDSSDFVGVKVKLEALSADGVYQVNAFQFTNNTRAANAFRRYQETVQQLATQLDGTLEMQDDDISMESVTDCCYVIRRDNLLVTAIVESEYSEEVKMFLSSF